MREIRVRMQALRRLPPVRIAEPCVGIGALRSLFAVGGLEFESTNAMDVDASLSKFWENIAGTSALDLTFGSEAGDVCRIPLCELADAEGCVSGPPCTPWAPNGKRKGRADTRANVWESVIDWIIELSDRGVLLFFALEGSKELMSDVDGMGSHITKTLDKLAVALPFFRCDARLDHLADYWPQVRNATLCFPSPHPRG